jgi:hypothetical protein
MFKCASPVAEFGERFKADVVPSEECIIGGELQMRSPFPLSSDAGYRVDILP